MPQHSTYYSSQDSFLLAVDCIILGFLENEIKLLVHHREMEPAKGGVSLMGGFVRNNESLNQAATRVLTNLTGLENIFMEQVGTYGDVDRDPGERVISSVYYALIDLSSYDEELIKQHNAFWISIGQAEELIFDHPQMVADAITILRRKASLQPIGFNLLPEKFTMTQLQSLYEAIYGHEMDKRNFRKKMLSLGFLQKLDEVDKSSSKKGAFFYQFKQDRMTLLQTSYEF